VVDSLVWQHCPIPHVDIVIHVFEKKGSILSGRQAVWAPVVDGVLVVEGPREGFEDGRGPCGSQTGKVLHSGMLEAMDGWVN
jgi:hypothetical protein